MALVKYLGEGRVVDYTPGAAVAAGDVVVQGDLVGVARSPIASNAPGSLVVSGILEFPKAAGAGSAITVGSKVYWYPAAKVATTNDGGGTRKLIGKTVKATVDADTAVQVRMSQ